MPPKYTFELTIKMNHPTIKDDVASWMIGSGIESFVEEIADGLDIDDCYERTQEQLEELLSANQTGYGQLQLYSYEVEYLLDLEMKLQETFQELITTEITHSLTSEWLDGWKDSFKPIATPLFYIYPPWLEGEASEQAENRRKIVIDPGIAFGTGQHATTRLCLSLLEHWWATKPSLQSTVLDVGMGTGILAIAAKKLGLEGTVEGCDIEADAVQAAHTNAEANGYSMTFWAGSLGQNPNPGQNYDLVFANILAVVISSIMDSLSQAVKPGGYIILSGILDEQKAPIYEKAKAFGLELVEEHQEQDWIGALLKKKPS